MYQFNAKDSASERNESSLSNCRTQPILCKDSASERNESLLSNCRAQPILCKDKKLMLFLNFIFSFYLYLCSVFVKK